MPIYLLDFGVGDREYLQCGQYDLEDELIKLLRTRIEDEMTVEVYQLVKKYKSKRQLDIALKETV